MAVRVSVFQASDEQWQSCMCRWVFTGYTDLQTTLLGQLQDVTHLLCGAWYQLHICFRFTEPQAGVKSVNKQAKTFGRQLLLGVTTDCLGRLKQVV